MATFDLYQGEVQLDFNEAKHFYTVDGNKVDSVTQILGVINKPALKGWAVKMAGDHLKTIWKPGKAYDEIQIDEMIKDAKSQHRKKATDAASIGTLVHQYAEDYFLGLNPKMPINEQAKKNCRLFLQWVEDHRVECIEPEFKVYSRNYNYAGTCDLDCIIDGKRTILDFKNSSGIYPEAHIQTSAYAFARQEELPVEYEARTVVNFNKKTGVPEIETRDMVDQFVADFAAFTGALNIKNAIADISGKKR